MAWALGEPRFVGRATLGEFIKMELFNPDRSWKPVLEE